MPDSKKTVSTEKSNVKECDCEILKVEIEQLKKERDQYKAAYEQLYTQNSNLWGLYSNTIDYIVTQTKK